MIRQMFKLMAKPGIISFAGGAPDPKLFPKEELAEIAARILREQGEFALQYGVTEGYDPLRKWVTDRLTSQGAVAEGDDVIIISGGQQGIDLAAKSLINPGDGVICEQPSFVGGLNSFRSNNAELYGVPVLDDGMDMESLEKLLKEHSNVKVVYTIATFQNPSGITMSVEKRKKLLELAEEYDFIIFEDNPYGELCFDGENVPTIKSMDKNGRVVYFGSFSKILAPGLRLGFACCDAALMERMIICKQAEDVHTTLLAQMIAYEYVSKCGIDAHISKLREIYGGKCKLMMECMDKYFPSCVKHTCPKGGLFIFCTMPDGYDSRKVMERVLEKNVAIVPGVTTMIDSRAVYSTFRLNFSTSTPEDIEKGIKIIGGVLHEIVGDKNV